ncbi:carbohydrate-binding protein [Thioalkalivibrio sp.]|uniref:carbohydrate-binding protein n=1 Tax=Thioalkalivibrio sp. TaxID=2093813 RepID=UPI0039771EC2
MRKRIIPDESASGSVPEGDWLDLDSLAEVEITSEDPDHPIEHALLPGSTSGWRAGQPGEQTIRLVFHTPQPIERIRLHFKETQIERTQQFVLRWSPDHGQTHHEIIRQQWTFSPGGSHEQIEDIDVTLSAVTRLELTIIPDISGGPTPASLAQLHLGGRTKPSH